MNLKIKKADKRHFPEINDLIISVNISDPLNSLPGSFWFVRRDGKIIGCVGGEFIDGKTFVVLYLAVDKPYRRQGIGMALFGHAVDYATIHGAKTVSFITMYCHFNRFKKRGFRTMPRKNLPAPLQYHWMYRAKRYMKCAAMIKRF